jgi:HEPN domain-containing protein
MNIDPIRKFWEEEALEALTVADHLFEKGDYSYALFFGHLAVEKIIKALYVVKKKGQAPYLHNLFRLAELIEIPLTETQKNQLIKITAYHLESRYPDEKRSFRRKCDQDFTRAELAEINEVFQWLKSMLP